MQIEEVCKDLPPERFVVYIEKLRAVTKGEFRSKMLSLGTLQREMFSFLNWDEVRALQKAGFTIGSHTIEHPILTRISVSQRTRELQESRARIASETGTECHYFAYPNGGERDVNPEVIQAVQQAGYDVAFTLTGRLCKRPCPPLSCERIWIPGRLSMSALRTRTSSAHTKIRNVLMHAWRNGTVDGGQDGPAIAKGATAANMADRTS
jgi:peptidoglycan/xylan/chitin deacetylase (PgdA/CDA1 family)